MISNQQRCKTKALLRRALAVLIGRPGDGPGDGIPPKARQAEPLIAVHPIIQPDCSQPTQPTDSAPVQATPPEGVCGSPWKINLPPPPARANFSKVPVNNMTPVVDDEIGFGSLVAFKAPALEASTYEETSEPVPYPVFQILATQIMTEVPGRRYPLSARVIDSWFGSLPDWREKQPNGQQDAQALPPGTLRG